MKTKLNLFLFLIIISGIFVFSACGSASTTSVHSIASAKTDFYNTEAGLFGASTVVIIADKTEKEENVVKDMAGNGSYYGYTLSDISVKDVLKNETPHELKSGDVITLLENQFSVNVRGVNTVYHTNYYYNTIPGNSYILYLGYSPNDGTYYVTTGFQGKIPLSDNESILYSPGSNEKTDAYYDTDEYNYYTSVQEGIRADALNRI